MISASRAIAPTSASILDDLDLIRSLGDAHDFLNRIVREHGFAHHAALRFAPESEGRPTRQLAVTSFTRDVVQAYERAMLASGSRSMASARRSARPFAWNRHSPQPRGEDQARAVLATAGVTMGVTLPVAGRDGDRGLVMLGGDRSAPALEETALLSLVAHGLFDRIVAIQNEERYTRDFRLTLRERQCLMWTSAGKTAPEIADILELSEQMVEHHLAGCIDKLGAVNRTQAVAKAIRLRVID
jgi:LuxR family transcriptional regulator, quorum-sensing system regulator BjaR1